MNVAVVDSGINPNLAEFAGRIHPASRDVASNRGVVDNEGHGTAVSGVIAAARNGSGPMGVAFESTIMSFNTANPDNCDAKTGCKHSDTAIGQAIDLARQNGARVINVSLGGDGVGSAVLNATHRAAQAGIVVVISAGNDSNAEPSRFAFDTATRAGNGHVIIAGSVGVPVNGDPAQGTDLSQLSSFSNKAGAGAQHYLAALGYRVRTFDENGTGYLYNGTSFSAPVISGAAALLAHAFPNLTGRQIVELLLNTADDLGAPGADNVFGRGRLNIQRAFQPQGGTKTAGSGVAVSTTKNGSASGPMGDAGGTSFGAIVLDGYSRAYVLDLARTLSHAPQERPLAEGLQSAVSVNSAASGATAVSIAVRQPRSGAAQVALAPAGLTDVEHRRAEVVAGHALTRLTPDTAVALGFSESGRALQQRLAGTPGLPFLVARDPTDRTGFHTGNQVSAAVRHDLGPVALTVAGERGTVATDKPLLPSAGGHRPQDYGLFSLTADRRIGSARLSLGLSHLQEEDTVLGGQFSFAPGGSESWLLDAGAAYDLGANWSAAARYRRGLTLMPGGNGLVGGGRMVTDAWAFDLTKAGAFATGDQLAFRVMQPLRVRSGGYAMNLPVSYDYSNGTVGYNLSEFSLAPKGREIDYEVAYGMSMFEGAGWLSANAFLRREPGHVEARRDDLGAAVRFSFGF